MSGTQWMGRVVTDVVGSAGSVVLDEESTAQRDLEDWLHDYYEIDDDEAERLSENLTAGVIADGVRAYARGRFGLTVALDGEWSAERSAREIYEYLEARGENVTMSRTSVSVGAVSLALGDDRGETGDEALAGAWWKCSDGEGEGWVWDKADMRDAAEYLRAVAREN